MTASAIAPAGSDTATPRNLVKRLAWIERSAGPLAGKQIIDCGCGAGEYVRALAQRGAQVWGIEYSEEKIRESRASGLPADRVTVGDIERMEFDDAHFDVALLNEVLEHVPDDRRGLREVHRVLAPGGTLVVFSPNRLYPFETHGVALRSGKPVPHYTPFVPYVPVRLGVFDYWARNYWPWELRALVRESGFAIERTGYVWQTFENISGNQPGWMRAAGPFLRALSDACERIPGVNVFGVSQLVVARKTA